MRTCLLAALALIVSAAGCSTLKPSHREYSKAAQPPAAAQVEPQHAIQQVQYAEPAGGYPAQQAYAPPQGYQAQPGYPAQQAGHLLHGHGGHAHGANGCPGGNCPGYGGHGHAGHGGHAHGGHANGGPRGYHKLFDGGRYGHFNGAHHTPGYPHHHFSREYTGPQGPPTAQTAYPYYTTRGPRDFLLDNPPSIGR